MTAKISRPTAAAGGPARKITVQKQSSNRYVLLAVKILLALIIFLLLPKLIESRRSTMKKFNYRNKRQRRLAEVVLKETRLICEMHICRAIIAEEAMNCVQVCISPACYQQHYDLEPLEDGELDIERARLFELCVQTELRDVRKRQRQTPELFQKEEKEGPGDDEGEESL